MCLSKALSPPASWSYSQFSLCSLLSPLGGDHSARSPSGFTRQNLIFRFQLQLTGNGGQPAHIRLTLEDKSKMNVTAWSGCVIVSSGQVWVFADQCSICYYTKTFYLKPTFSCLRREKGKNVRRVVFHVARCICIWDTAFQQDRIIDPRSSW